MQYQQAQKRGDTRLGFFNPSLIHQSQHDFPLKLKDDSEELRAGKTKAEKEAIREKLHRNSKAKVASYICNALKFFHDKKRDQILAPYNFEYVNTLPFTWYWPKIEHAWSYLNCFALVFAGDTGSIYTSCLTTTEYWSWTRWISMSRHMRPFWL